MLIGNIDTVLKLADHVGMPWCSDQPDPWVWDGQKGCWGNHLKAVRRIEAKPVQNGLEQNAHAHILSNVVHEIAHWLICPMEYRNLPDFGLGFGPDSTDFSALEIKMRPGTLDTFREEERKASALGILIEKALGLSYLATLEYHDWSLEEDLHRALRGAGVLLRRRPVCLKGFRK